MLYELYQNHQKNSSAYMKYFARPVITKTVGLAEIAKKVQKNCSMKESDCMAVLTELQDVMIEELQNGHAVKLDKIGTFKVGMTSEGVNIPADYKPSENVKNVYINFQQAWTRSAGQPVQKYLTNGIRWEKMHK